MAVRRDSLRAKSDFFSPMTGNTSKTRFAGERRGSYTEEAKKRLQDLDTGRRESPVIEAIKVAVQKTEDPFTKIADKKSYAPEEKNDFMGALEGAAGAAQDVVSEGVSKVEDVVRSTGRRAAERRAEQQYKRQQERAADLKAAESARQNIRTDFQNRIKGVSDEVGGVRQQVKTYESNREKQRQLTQARLKGIESKQETTARETKSYRDNRERQRALRQSALDKRISGVESGVSGVRSEVKAYETNREKQRRLTQSRLKGVETGLSNLGKDYKAQEQRAIDNMAKFRAEQAAKFAGVDTRLGEQDKKVSEVKTNLATTYGGVIGLQKSLAEIKERQNAPKTVTIDGQTVAAKQSVASLPSNYKATEAEAFRVAKAYQEAKKLAERNPNVSVSVDSKGRPTATANQQTRSEAGARTAQANAARVKSNAVARAQAAAVNRKLSGKSISQTKAANTASMKAAAAARHASFKKAKAAGTHARTASAQRARNRAAAKARAKAAAKRRRSKKSCPDPSMLILMANGSQKRAGDLMVGDLIKTNHEKDMKLGEYKVEYVNVINDIPKTKLTFEESRIVCSLTHKFYVDNDWKEAKDMKVGDEVSGQKLISIENVEDGDVVHITVEDAHTYICEGLLSHNKRCDIRSKDDIAKLTDMNLLRDDLADVAYFVKELQETI